MNSVEAYELVIATACSVQVVQWSLVKVPRAIKDATLEAMVHSLTKRGEAILVVSITDLEHGCQDGMKPGLLDRPALDSGRPSAIVDSPREVAAPPDPVGQVTDDSVVLNGLRVRRVWAPLGVVGMIYEVRPNVIADIAAPAVKSGNAIILHGGSATRDPNVAIVAALRGALETQGLPTGLVTSANANGQDGVRVLIRVRGLTDALVSWGGVGLVRTVVEQSTVPVIEAELGSCHAYVDASVDLGAAVDTIVDARTQRVDVCNAAETPLVHADVAAIYLPAAARALWDKDTVLHANPTAYRILTEVATIVGRDILLAQVIEADWDAEYGSLDLAVCVVKSLEEATDHIHAHTTGRIGVVPVQDVSVINGFTAGTDLVAVMASASTRFIDGGQLGLGAKLGISIQKLHAHGPMGLNEPTTATWIVEGNGHIRP